MDYEQLQQYKKWVLERALSEGTRRNEEQSKIWSDYKERHEKLILSLETFQQELTVDCMVPIGKKALMRGKLVHTNEILVSLGAGYFAKYSAAQAIALCHRRIKRADDILEGLEKEQRLFEMRQTIPSNFDAFGGEERKELLEHWDNDKLNNWRVEHRQREKEYRKKLSELKNTEKQEIQTEKDLFERLDMLELQEELEDDLHRLEAAYPDFYEQDLENGKVYEESESDSLSDASHSTEGEKEEDIDEKSLVTEEKEATMKTKNLTNTDVGSSTVEAKECQVRERKVAFGESQVKYFKNNDKTENISQHLNFEASHLTTLEAKAGTSSQGNSMTIEDTDDEASNDDEVIRIDVKHNDYEPEILQSEGESIQSPRDIYRMLSKPKSILKKSPNHTTRVSSYAPPVDDSTDEEIEDNPAPVVSAYNTIVKDIQERHPESRLVNVIEPVNQKRAVSKFKRERASINK